MSVCPLCHGEGLLESRRFSFCPKCRAQAERQIERKEFKDPDLRIVATACAEWGVNPVDVLAQAWLEAFNREEKKRLAKLGIGVEQASPARAKKLKKEMENALLDWYISVTARTKAQRLANRDNFIDRIQEAQRAAMAEAQPREEIGKWYDSTVVPNVPWRKAARRLIDECGFASEDAVKAAVWRRRKELTAKKLVTRVAPWA